MLISFDFESFQRCKNLFAEEGISSGNITMHAQTSSPNRQFQNSDIDFDDVKHQDASNCSESHCSARNTKSNGLRLAVRARIQIALNKTRPAMSSANSQSMRWLHVAAESATLWEFHLPSALD